MSFDYTVVVRARKRKTARIRAIAAGLAPLLRQAADEVEDGDDDVDLSFDGLGSVQVRRLSRGYEVSIDSNRDSNRESWEALGELVDRLAKELGEIIEDPELAAKMSLETDDEDAAPNGRMAVLTLEDREGRVLETVAVFIEAFVRILDPGGMPFPCAQSARPAMFEEAHRYPLGAARMRARLHDDEGIVFRTFEWTLDGYGRITRVDIAELPEEPRYSRTSTSKKRLPSGSRKIT